MPWNKIYNGRRDTCYKWGKWKDKKVLPVNQPTII
jgi:hypothetical protein